MHLFHKGAATTTGMKEQNNVSVLFTVSRNYLTTIEGRISENFTLNFIYIYAY